MRALFFCLQISVRKVLTHFLFQATVGQERHVACELILKDYAKCCFGLTIFCEGFVAFLPINSQRAIFRAKNKEKKSLFTDGAKHHGKGNVSCFNKKHNCPLFRLLKKRNIVCGLYRHLKGLAISQAAVCILEVGDEYR